MRIFVWNVLLSLFWVLLSQQFTLLNLTFGFVIGFLVLLAARRSLGEVKYFRKVVLAISFAFFFAGEIVRASIRVAHDVLTPRHRMLPGVVAIPLEARTEVEITFLANFLSMTPGTLSLEISEDRKTLYVHSMYIDRRDVHAFRRSIKERVERRVLELMR